ncbi:MFS transporter [soil metagenome]
MSTTTDPAAESTQAADAHDAKWWTLAAVCTGVFMLLLDITIVNVALPDIQTDLDASLSDLQWVIDAYALSLAALLLTAGSLADLYGRRLVFVIGLVLFTLGSVACGLAQDILLLTMARAFQGIGGAAMFATALALLASAFSGRDRGIAFGLFGATTGVAVAVGPVLGGVLTSGLSWRWIFFVNIPICLVALAIATTRVEESHDPKAGTPDWAGFLTFSGSLALLVYGLIRSGEEGWGDDTVLACLVGAGFLFVVFLLVQAGARHPMFDLALLRKPTFGGGLIAAFGVSASVFSLLAYLVLYIQGVLGFSAVQSGFRLVLLSAAAFVFAAIAGRLTEKVPTKLLIGPGFLILGVGLFLLHGIPNSSDPDSWHHLIPGLIVCGVAIGLINPPLASTAVGVVPPQQAGMASGANSTFRQVGIATGIATLGSLFANQVGREVTDGLQGTPGAGQADQIAAAITGGQVQRVIDAAPPTAREQLSDVATSSFVDSLNHIIVIAMVLAFATGVLTLLLIRQKDFVGHGGPRPDDAGGDTGGDAEGDAIARTEGEPAADDAVPEAAGVGGAHRSEDDPGRHLA